MSMMEVFAVLIIHWPHQINPGSQVNQMCAHIDIVPTLLDACDVALEEGVKVDGRSFLPLFQPPKSPWPERTLVFQAHRGNQPQRYHQFALHRGPWKLVHPTGFGNETFSGEPKLQLYHLEDDPRQKKELSAAHPQKLRELTNMDWFDDVSSTRDDNYAPPRIVIGTEHELNTTLTRQDWRHESGRPWGRDSNGFWCCTADPAHSR